MLRCDERARKSGRRRHGRLATGELTAASGSPPRRPGRGHESGSSSGQAALQQRLAELAVAIGAGTAGESRAALAQRFVERVRELNRTVGIPDKLAALKAVDVPEVARAAMIEAHRDYPVPKNMRLPEAEALLQRCLA